MTLDQQLGVSLRKISENTTVWECVDGHGAWPATPLEQRMYALLRSLPQYQA